MPRTLVSPDPPTERLPALTGAPIIDPALAPESAAIRERARSRRRFATSVGAAQISRRVDALVAARSDPNSAAAATAMSDAASTPNKENKWDLQRASC